MEKQIISQQQATSIVYLAVLSGILTQGVNAYSGPDTYISNCIALILAIPLYLILTRLIHLYPGKDLFEIAEAVLGKFFGKFVTVICILSAVVAAAYALRGYSYYIYIESIPETPLYFLYIAFLLLAAFTLYLGVEASSRMAHAMAWVYTVFALLVLALSLNVVHYEYIRPVMYDGFAPVFKGALNLLVFPYGTAVFFLATFAHLKPGSKVFGIFMRGNLYAFVIIGLVLVRNLLVLGPESIDLYLYPSHQAISMIGIGNFLERMEVLPAIINLFCDITKLYVCSFFAAKGLQRLFNMPGYRLFISPVIFLVFVYSLLSKDFYTDVIQWRQAVIYFLLPVEFIIPLILYLIAEIRHRIAKMLQNMAQTAS